ncbi:hypothetical protein Xcel_0529 [Xylanimonas cellulosilytica DSM 15894]|uniref:Uncharacterized protein n=1 Tax=Xylanimonas cellulosilytica (strain DSM 15894 / JCM 12276 / CECT 5975 / KCTC 9989 / LMG 20990 / NBRC 107835 / XIL07) TaxID=446471 RepID=D1BW65_XYLCX|nr:hypothetical protein [Xylanimonas cellulosilytica]ACZ29568.1 hypothetical protein Xcel_0529 [Xylanimonas cellulosilytica DSM 15894]
MARIVDLGVTQYTWVPGVAGLTTPSAPLLADLSGAPAKNISQYVVTTTDVNPDPSDTVNERAVTDTSNAVVPTVGNYHGNLVLFRDFTAGAPTANDPITVFGSGDYGWLVRRLGKPASTALAADDIVDVFLFLVDNVTKTGGTGDGYLKANITLLQQGQFYTDVAVVAGT